MTGTPDPRVTLPQGMKPLSRLGVSVPVVPMHRKASRQSPRETELLRGHGFDLYKVKGAWAWGQAVSPVIAAPFPGYIGWISRKALGAPIEPTHVVSALSAPLFKRPDIKSPVLKRFPLGSLLQASDRAKDFIITAEGFIHRHHVTAEIGPLAEDFVAVAEAHMGLPYIWGGISPQGLDCSGLVLSALRAAGRDAPRDADMQEAQLGEEVSSDLRRGDLIFWPGHVGIMSNEETLLHANAYHMVTAKEPLAKAVVRIGNYRSAKRLT